MATRWSADRVMALAPDASSRQAAVKLAGLVTWAQAGAAGDVVWGLCAGSGKHPYQVIADVSGPAYTCSCPSRKFPCKHAVALLLNWADGLVPEAAQPPGFAESWIASRAGRAGRVGRATAPARPAPTAAKAKPPPRPAGQRRAPS